MDKSIIFLLVTLLKLTQQTQPICNQFGISTPREADLQSIAFEVRKLKKKFRIPVLADYSYESQDVINRDYSCYNEGMNDPDDARLTITQLAQKYGFELKNYNNVKTADGYRLTLHRIPNDTGDVVFLNHGLMGSSADYLMAGKSSLPFILATLSYDVWFGNFRGNKYSYTHESLTPDCAEFWDFSYDEFGNYDLPASIDFIRDKTGQDKITCICHSVSTTAFFVMASLRPEYNEKICQVIALSPMAYSSNIRSPLLRLFAENEDITTKIKRAMGPYEFKPSDTLTENLRTAMCDNNTMAQVLCSHASFLITGFNEKCLNLENFYTISQHYPAGGSTKTLMHYSQNVNSRQFRRFDYADNNVNIDKYESVTSPAYPVENINVTISFILSYNDFLSNVTDVMNFAEHLPNVGDVVYVDDCSSLDFLWGTHVADEVYRPIVDILNKYRYRNST